MTPSRLAHPPLLIGAAVSCPPLPSIWRLVPPLRLVPLHPIHSILYIACILRPVEDVELKSASGPVGESCARTQGIVCAGWSRGEGPDNSGGSMSVRLQLRDSSPVRSGKSRRTKMDARGGRARTPRESLRQGSGERRRKQSRDEGAVKSSAYLKDGQSLLQNAGTDNWAALRTKKLMLLLHCKYKLEQTVFFGHAKK
ncbi:hypothetical protein B0H14DRAFT_2584634 [Mycena olivaceomarginata]|nr:hypothetical protein B0H14DRAFT_2584634 [Mycena olivaceomarginata]